MSCSKSQFQHLFPSTNKSFGIIGQGRPITRSRNSSNSSTSSTSKRLHVSNIPFSMKGEDLKTLFKPFGNITDAQIISNNRGSKGFGFVTFENFADAVTAKNVMDGYIINDRQIEVNDALPKNKYTIIPKAGHLDNPFTRNILAELNNYHVVASCPRREPIRQSNSNKNRFTLSQMAIINSRTGHFDLWDGNN